jgi:hypothetical protein
MARRNKLASCCTLAALEGVLVSGWLLAIPGDGGAWLGLSAGRAALLAAALGGTAVFAAAVFSRSLQIRIENRRSKIRPARALVFLACCLILSIHFILNAWTTPNEALRPLLQRLAPFAAWGALLAVQAPLILLPAAPSRLPPRARAALGALLVFAAAWFPRGYALDRFVTADEPVWAAAGANFYYALRAGDFAATHQFEHPAVTLMWAGTAGILWRFPGYPAHVDGEVGPGAYENLLPRRGFDKTDLLAAGRFFVALGNAAILSLCFLYARALWGDAAALFGGLLAAWDPFHAAHTRLLTLDGTLASLMTLSVLAFLCALATGRRRDVLVSGVAAGLAWLTKTPGFFLVPVICLLAVRLLWGARAPGEGASRRGARLAGWLALWGAAGLAVFVILFPAMWVQPAATLADMFTQAVGYAAEGHRGAVFFAGEVIEDGRLGAGSFFYPVSFWWRTNAAVLAGLLAAWAAAREKGWRAGLGGLAAYAIVFTALQSLGGKQFDRYLLPAHLPLDFAAGAGLARAARRRGWWVAAVFAFPLFALAQTFPYYLSYYNPLAGGAARAPAVMMIGWGEGLDEAGRYLAAQPGAANLRVISWYNQGCFSYFFPAASEHFPTGKEPSPERLEEILAMDYAVIYIHQWQRDVPASLLDILAARVPEHSIWLDGIEYARIYRLDGD